MPRQPTQGQILAEFNALVPRAQELGLRVRTRAEWRGGRAAIQARLDELRRSIAQFAAPSLVGDENRFFGCEFEFHMPRGMDRHTLAARLTAAGIPARVTRYDDKSVSASWKVTTDGSLGNYSTGTELVSPKLAGPTGFEAVRKALKTLTDLGCKINRQCGFHVHVGVRQDGTYRGEQLGFFKNLAHLYRKFEPALDSIVAVSRRGRSNTWCGPVEFSDRDVEHAASIDEIGRMGFARNKYRKVNFATYWRQGTIEFRHHQGTLNALTATKWISLILRIVEAASKKSLGDITSLPDDLASLLSLVGADEDLTYFSGRVTTLATGRAA